MKVKEREQFEDCKMEFIELSEKDIITTSGVSTAEDSDSFGDGVYFGWED